VQCLSLIAAKACERRRENSSSPSYLAWLSADGDECFSRLANSLRACCGKTKIIDSHR
jgi:hypothetical protein